MFTDYILKDIIIKHKKMKFLKYLTFIFLAITTFNCSGPIVHEVIENFDNGFIKTISIFQNSSKLQKIEFSNDGNILTRSFYRNNCLFAIWTSAEFFEKENLVLNYYGNGVLKSQGHIIDNTLHGHWSYYDRHGHIESDRYYFYGNPIGDWYSYYHGETEVEHHEYIKGNGSWTEYYNADLNLIGENKLLKKESSFFNNNKLSGSYDYYYKNGNVKVSGYYYKGKKNGKWEHYNKQGALVKTENYNKGLLDGDFKLFFNDGVTEKLIGKYSNNKRSETWFWFFDINKKSSHKASYPK